MQCPAFRLALLFVVALPALSFANPIVINFDNLPDGASITNQYGGVTFSNAVALAAGMSLNEFEFPPLSGDVVAADDGAPVRIDFAQPVAMVSGYFTYVAPLVLRAFDASNVLLGSVSSAFSNNLALSGENGSVPNEFLQLAFGNISYVTFTGDVFGGSFALDNLSFEVPGQIPVPEPGTIILTLLGAVALRRRRR